MTHQDSDFPQQPFFAGQAHGGGGDGGHLVKVSTTFEIPGHEIVEFRGPCYGLVVRSMGFAKGIGASFRALAGGEVRQYTALLEDSRRHSLDRLVENCQIVGGNAVLGMRFDSSEIGQQLTEIVAYGTAVIVRPV